MKILLPAGLAFAAPLPALGNLVWPALEAETRVTSVPIIALSLVLEYCVIRLLFQKGVGRSILYTIIANAVSGALGLVLRPLSGLAWEVSLGALVMWIFSWGTYNPVAWFSVPVIGGAVNAALELLAIRLIGKEKFTRKNFLVFWVANTVTVGLSTLWVVLRPPML